MSILPPHLQALRTTFQTCRPRSSLKLRSSSVGPCSRRLYTPSRSLRDHSTTQSTPFTPPQSSVSQDEVSHFSRLASSWWDPHGPSRLLHLMNPLRHDFISACLSGDASSTPNAKKTYLDIGCGGGIFASSAARKPHTQSVTAIDPTPEVIAVAKAQQRTDPGLAEPKLTYLNCAIEDLPSQPSTSLSSSSPSPSHPQPTQYDIITLFEVIEHINTPSTFLTTALNHLKPGGWLIGSTISRHPLSYLTTKVIGEAPLIGVVPRGTHDWNKYIKPAEMRDWFGKQEKAQNPVGQSAEGVEEGEDVEYETRNAFGPVKVEGVVYVPLLGWRFVKGSEEVGNYFFGVQKLG